MAAKGKNRGQSREGQRAEHQQPANQSRDLVRYVRGIRELLERFVGQYHTDQKTNETTSRDTVVVQRSAVTWTRIYTAITAAIFLIAAAQAYIAHDTEIVSNRAYIGSDSFRLINYGFKYKEMMGWEIHPIIENSGNTPPKHLMIKSDTVIVLNENNWFDWNWNTSKNFFLSVIGPKSEDVGGRFELNSGQMDEVAHHKILIGAAGIIRFHDFADKPHYSEFCYYSQFPYVDYLTYTVGQPIRTHGLLCKDHNCADDECGADWPERAKDVK